MYCAYAKVLLGTVKYRTDPTVIEITLLQIVNDTLCTASSLAVKSAVTLNYQWHFSAYSINAMEIVQELVYIHTV